MTAVPYMQGMVAEAVGTIVLVHAVMTLAVDSGAPLGWAGMMIGLSVAAAILLIAPQTGGSLNPARTFGPDMVATLFGGALRWSEFARYCEAPLAGGLAAAVGYDLVARPRSTEVGKETYRPPSRDSNDE